MRLNYAIVFVSDMKRSVAFYRDILGIPLRFESPNWTEFATDGGTLALHLAGNTSTAATDSKDPGTCKPGLAVDDLDAFHARMTASGVSCVQTPSDVFGTRIAQYLDPDGLAISVSEIRRG